MTRLAGMQARKAEFLAEWGTVGESVLEVFNTEDPYGCYFGDENPDEYVGLAVRYLKGEPIEQVIDMTMPGMNSEKLGKLTSRLRELEKEMVR